jgi:hypothetical protein
MNDFFRTIMGQRFFEGTLPSLVREIARLNDNLEKSRDLQERMLASAEAADKAEAARSNAVSRDYVLNQLAGMKFPGQGEAYDFMKKCMEFF